ncbi:MAG: menaquinone biosynthesis protein [Saprospiraceae bacterium]|nr:menaquinone biosynthesis protein [Saprospiraceae bacterium]
MRIAAVKYHNTLPFLSGLRQSDLAAEIEIVLDHPANCAVLLGRGEVDIALCPVGALVDFDRYFLITDFGIGCDGAVRTVAVYSHVPVEQLRHVVLTPSSRTSNLLVQLLEQAYWRIGLTFHTNDDDLDPSQTGYLHIGDTCFTAEKDYRHICDLGASWKQHTGLPFVFACWTSLTPVEPELESRLSAAFGQGVRQLDQLVSAAGFNGVDLQSYLKYHIHFRLDARKRKAMQLFLNAVRNLPTLPTYAVQDPR